MRLQVSEWRPRRAGVCLGASASHRVDGSRGLVAAARRLVRSRRAVRVHHRTTGRRAGMTRFNCGTPPVLSLAALECGVDTVLAAERYGGLDMRAHEIGHARHAVHHAGAITLRGIRPSPRLAARSRRARQPGLLRASRRRLRDRPGADRPRRDRRLPRARPDAIRLHAALHALRRRLGRRRSPAQVLASGEWRDPRFATRAAVT